MKIKKLANLPGTNAKPIVEKNRLFRFPKARMTQFVAKSGNGVFQEDEDGNVFLDFSAGIAVVNTSHCHPKVVKAIQHQAETLIHTGPFNFSKIQVALANFSANAT